MNYKKTIKNCQKHLFEKFSVAKFWDKSNLELTYFVNPHYMLNTEPLSF